MLHHPKAERQFHNDIEAMEACDTCVLVLPCGRSAHTEAGWFAGKGKTTIAYIPEKQEPELMYKLFDGVCCSINELIKML
jgi:nucleoside 2-deoxyribosyltransferase